MITDRRLAGGDPLLLELIRRRIGDGVSMIQIREKDLEAGDLFRLAGQIMNIPRPRDTRIIVNSRLDVALAVGAGGVHLPAGSPPPSHLRAIVPPGFQIGVSCHSVDEVKAAEQGGAGYVIFGPVFAPRSKAHSGPIQGIEGLRVAAASVKIPVLAIGGIATANADSCHAAGIAGISLFL